MLELMFLFLQNYMLGRKQLTANCPAEIVCKMVIRNQKLMNTKEITPMFIRKH